MFDLVPKRTGHTTTPAVDFACSATRTRRQHLHRRRRPAGRLLVAMAVEQHRRSAIAETQPFGRVGEHIRDETVHRLRNLADPSCRSRPNELRQLIRQRPICNSARSRQSARPTQRTARAPATFSCARRFASSSRPLLISGRPQHTLGGTSTSCPSASSTFTVAMPTSGV